jgi:transposase
MTMIGAIAIDGVRAMMSIDSGTDTDVFAAFIEKVLAPELRTGDIVVMDNLSAHKTPRIRNLIEQAGVEILLLPAYSPEFNPIEQAWAKIKTFLRRCKTLTRDAFDQAFADAIQSVSMSDLIGWIRNAGYTIREPVAETWLLKPGC